MTHDEHGELHVSIREALHADAGRAPDGSGLDAGAAISGARRRRRPKVAIATGATAFAAVGILAITLPSVLQPISMISTSGGAPMSDQIELSPPESATEQADVGAETELKRAPAERIALCGSVFPFAVGDEPVASMSGLAVEVVLDPAGLVSGEVTVATARLTNPTPETITGATTTAAAGVVGVDGVTSWHSPGGLGAVDLPFSLAPGASIDLPLPIAASACTVDDDLVALETGAYPDDLAALAPGAAVVVAALDVSVESSDAMMLLDLVVSPPVAVQIVE
jgi:hypothetical protein